MTPPAPPLDGYLGELQEVDDDIAYYGIGERVWLDDLAQWGPATVRYECSIWLCRIPHTADEGDPHFSALCVLLHKTGCSYQEVDALPKGAEYCDGNVLMRKG